MPDIRTPKADFIFGKTGAEAAALLTKLSDSTEVAKQMKLLYSAAEITAIFDSGKMSSGRMTDIISSASYTGDERATQIDDSGPGVCAAVLMESSATDARTLLHNVNLSRDQIENALHSIPEDEETTLRNRYSNLTRFFSIWMSPGCGDMLTARTTHSGYGTGYASMFAISGKGGSPWYEIIEDSEFYEGGVADGFWSTHMIYDPATPRYDHASAGQAGSALVFGGRDTYEDRLVSSETMPGSGAGGDLNTAICDHIAIGASGSAILSCGGDAGGASHEKATEKYNGTAWATDADMNYDRAHSDGCGTTAAGLIGGYFNGSLGYLTEEYNGAAWGAGGNMNDFMIHNAMFGTQTSAWSCGGQTYAGMTPTTENYDGAAWSVASIGDLNTTRRHHAAVWDGDMGITCGGNTSLYVSSVTADTEELI